MHLVTALTLRLAALAVPAFLAWEGAALAHGPLHQPPLGQPPVGQPKFGQPGKDVGWAPTRWTVVEQMLDIAKVGPRDYLVDLGSGDGRTVIAAAQRGARAHGIEYNPELVELSKARAEEAGVSGRATFEEGDLFEADFSRATVITMFLGHAINNRLLPRLVGLEPGTRVVSNTFTIRGWPPDETATVPECMKWCKALLWIVPADVEGTWRLGDDDLRLRQRFQLLRGTLGSARISDARLDGAEIAFTADGVRYVGTVTGDTMEGRQDGGSGVAWSAVRK